MSVSLRDGKFDVLIVAGPRIRIWPSIGAQTIASLCAESGLLVGILGGEHIHVKGVIPQQGVGALVFAQDTQKRIHRLETRSVVKISARHEWPDPFEGWWSPGLIPLSTVHRLQEYKSFAVPRSLVILGTGNRALRFGTEMLVAGCESVVCIETRADWSAKRIAGWEVERRRFERLGGRIVEAMPLSLKLIGGGLWRFEAQAAGQKLSFEVDWVITAGPFDSHRGVREYPPGAGLYELVQTSRQERNLDVEGWNLEMERGRLLGVKVIRSLLKNLGDRRDEVEKQFKRARVRLRAAEKHLEDSFMPAYQGKWMVSSDALRIRTFEGVPKHSNPDKLKAVIECVEPISCKVCQEACPEKAIQIHRGKKTFLDEDACTGCGKCLMECPSQVPIMMKGKLDDSSIELVIPYHAKRSWSVGELVTLLNRRGEALGSGRVKGTHEIEGEEGRLPALVRIEVPSHLAWETRGIRPIKTGVEESQQFWNAVLVSELGEKVEIILGGEKRLTRERLPLSAALFESRMNRAADQLFCPDGSCGLCHVRVDGVKKLACDTKVRKGMNVILDRSPVEIDAQSSAKVVCPCEKTSCESVETGGSAEALVGGSRIASGKCHGQICEGTFRRLLPDFDEQFSNWSFPWVDWTFPG